VTRFRAPLGPGVRVDTAVVEGAEIAPYYDSMIAKVIVHDVDRPAAIARAVRALEELEVGGVPTTREFALDVLRSPAFAAGATTTDFLAEMDGVLPSLQGA
jgi:acetyl-CoA carboxylase biotin carboxylase subunit